VQEEWRNSIVDYGLDEKSAFDCLFVAELPALSLDESICVKFTLQGFFAMYLHKFIKLVFQLCQFFTQKPIFYQQDHLKSLNKLTQLRLSMLAVDLIVCHDIANLCDKKVQLRRFGS